MTRQEPIQLVEQRREAALARLVQASPYHQFLGVRFDLHGDELTARLPFDDKLIGNPLLPALHGGATGAFMEIAAIIQLSWGSIWEMPESDAEVAANPVSGVPPLPKTVDFSIDYLRSGKPRDVFARAIVSKRGRQVANVRVEAWQDERDRPIATAHGHFLMPRP